VIKLLKKQTDVEEKILEELNIGSENESIPDDAKIQIFTLRRLRESSVANKTKSQLTVLTRKDAKNKGLELTETFNRIIQVLIRTEKDKKVRVNLITLSGDRKILGNIDKCYINSEVAIYNNLVATPLLGLGTYYKVLYLKDKTFNKRYLSIFIYTEAI